MIGRGEQPSGMDSSNTSANSVVEQLCLQPHPEGGWFREIHRGDVTVRRRDGQERSGLTVIWFLLSGDCSSRWHRVNNADETWHHAAGDPLELWILPPEGGVSERRLLGPLAIEEEGAQPVQVVPAGWWQAARCLGAWSLVTCCVGPGFDFQDFQLLRQLPLGEHPTGARSDLL